MVSPWSTNAVEITKNMGVESLIRIEEFNNVIINRYFDRMIHQKYDELNQKIFANISGYWPNSDAPGSSTVSALRIPIFISYKFLYVVYSIYEN